MIVLRTKTWLTRLAGVALAAMISSCVEIYDWENKLGRIPTPDTSVLLREALTGLPYDESTMGGIAGSLTSYSVEPGLYSQYFSQTQYPALSRYKTTSLNWDDYYTKALKDLQAVIQYNTNPRTKDGVSLYGANSKQLAIANILKVYYFWHVTDRWGDIPYFDALGDNPTPAYDQQKVIYYDFFQQLKEANKNMQQTEPAPVGDVLFYGDVNKWRMFSNSLRMLMALRISEADPEKAQLEFAEAFSEPGGYVQSNEDNIVIDRSSGSFENSWRRLFDQRDEYCVSDLLVTTLLKMNDPRVGGFAERNTHQEYQGLPYGLTPDSLIGWISTYHYSSLNSRIKSADFPGYIITSAQMHLAVCEAIIRGWVDGDPSEHYNIAIEHSFRQWNQFDEGTYTDYLLQPFVQINSGSYEEKLARVGMQRWIALYPNGFQAWCEWRRTGYPELTPTIYAINRSKQIPRRFAYPEHEKVINRANYLKAVESFSIQDTHDFPVWWDPLR